MDYAEALTLYEKLVATSALVQRKGDTVPYTSLNGNMQSALHKDGTVALRLPSPARESFLRKYKTTLAAHYGVVQPEYVVVPDKLLANTPELKPHFAASVAYVGSLKSKPTTGAKAKAKPKGPANR
ncbi:MAG TPA: hypothetical protein VGQ30_08845 [Gemmatimonadaceae bacterium]|nr:hypothetical protein [Gemmatimonadaceae bacterium]